MKTALVLATAGVLAVLAFPLRAHEVPNMEHTHAFKQTGYGTYRQGHSVSGPNGSIIIWSAQPKNSTNGNGAVNFARPEPITKAPSQPFSRPDVKFKETKKYGTESKKDYGQ